jgi:hypothetical protein
MSSVISGSVTSTVALGSAAYSSPLTVETGGSVEPSAQGSVGVYIGVAGSTLTNDGRIIGGSATTYQGYVTGLSAGVGVLVTPVSAARESISAAAKP